MAKTDIDANFAPHGNLLGGRDAPAMIVSPRQWPSVSTAGTRCTCCGCLTAPGTNEGTIFRLSIGSLRRQARDELPVLKSSMQNVTRT